MKRLLLSLLLLPTLAAAQTSTPVRISYASTDPSAFTCIKGEQWLNLTTGHLWNCKVNQTPPIWVDTTAAGGGGTTFPLLAPENTNGCSSDPQYGFSTPPANAGLCRSAGGQIMQLFDSDSSGHLKLLFDIDEFIFTLESSRVGGRTSRLMSQPDRLKFNVSTGAVFGNPALDLVDAPSNDFLTFTDVETGTKSITLSQSTAVPALTTTVTNGTVTNTYTRSALAVNEEITNGTAFSGYQLDLGSFDMNIDDDVGHALNQNFANGVNPSASRQATGTGTSVAAVQDSVTVGSLTVTQRIQADGTGNTATAWQEAADGTLTTRHSIAPTGAQDQNSGAQPTCDATTRRSRWYVQGGAGVADTYEVCMKDAADVYAWKVLATP